MNDFFRYPQTPHLAWLGAAGPREDKVLSAADADYLLEREVVVEEKLDGANLGISLGPDGRIAVQNRGQYLDKPYAGQFTRMAAWLAQHDTALRSVLMSEFVLFGEWCAARHSLDYISLPDWFLLFDVYEREAGRFWSTSRRNLLAKQAGLTTVPEVFHGKTTTASLQRLVATGTSRFRPGAMEGIVIRRESAKWCEARAKLVRPDFIQGVGTHWSKREIEWNGVQFQ